VASYSLVIKRPAAKELEDLTLKGRRRVVARIRELASHPRPPGCEKLSGAEKYRIRQGDIRVLYEIADREAVITIVRIGHRRDVYR
jgi:mRNA interferase RelE/StbE